MNNLRMSRWIVLLLILLIQMMNSLEYDDDENEIFSHSSKSNLSSQYFLIRYE